MLLRSKLRALDQLAAKHGCNPERAPHLVSGERGEDEAYFYLRNLGYTLVARDHGSPRRRGDIDLIAWEKEILCFAELKTRTSRNFMPNEAAVDDEKRESLSGLAREFLPNYSHAQGESPQFRFDVISVYLKSNEPSEITLFRDAFRMS